MTIKNLWILSIGEQIVYMDGQCHKSCLQMVLSGFKIHPNLLKISEKAAKKVETNDIFLKLMFNILRIYVTFTMIYYFYLTEWKLKKLKNL